MTSRTFKNPGLAACYAVSREQGADNFSTYYYSKTPIGPRHPTRGAGHRDAYWNGRLGVDPAKRYVRGTFAYAYCAAGADDRKTDAT